MENNKYIKYSDVSFAFLTGLVFTLAIAVLILLFNVNILQGRLDKLESNKDTIQISNHKLPENFNYAYKLLKAYNKNIDTITVIRITATANKFNLTNSKETFKLALGQLILESGVKHYVNNKILTSHEGALGIGQIIPNSAYGYLIKYAKEQDRLIFRQLGCKDFSFIFKKNLNKSEKVKKITWWLHDEANNIALWGFIMRKNINLNEGDVCKALVSYSDGFGGMQNYIDSGGNISNHNYIVGINNKLNKE